MASLEGGSFKCYIHDYETESVEEWNAHMGDKPHTDIIDTHCIECDTTISVEMPYQPIQADGSKGISLRCDECEAKQ